MQRIRGWEKALSAVLVLMTVALAGCDAGSQAQTEIPTGPIVQGKITNITTQRVTREDLEENFTLPGTLEAWEDLILAAEQSGPVRWIGPDEGDTVCKAEALLRIDPDTLEATVAKDRAEYNRQKSHLDRQKRLVEKKLVSQQEYEDTFQSFEVARANLKLSEVELAKSTLRSPVDGILDALMVDRGEYVAAGDPMAVIVQVEKLKVLIDVPEKDIPLLKKGQKVRIFQAPVVDDHAAAKEGTIIHLAYKADPDTRTYRAKLEIDNSDHGLRPGMIVRAEFARRKLSQVIAVPIYALLDRDGSKVVFTEENGVAHMQPVRTGAAIGSKVIILDGLESGDRLIVRGQHLVDDGGKVTEEN